jgi:hypothetical protein
MTSWFQRQQISRINFKLELLRSELDLSVIELDEHESTYDEQHLNAIVSESEHEKFNSAQTAHHVVALRKAVAKINNKIDKLETKRKNLLG